MFNQVNIMQSAYVLKYFLQADQISQDMLFLCLTGCAGANTQQV